MMGVSNHSFSLKGGFRMGQTTVLHVDHVSKQYGKKTVLEDVNFTIDTPEIIGFVGPSGAGKTTLVKMIAGMDVPSDGKINVFGEQMPNLSLMERMGYMGQSDALYGELTALQNLAFFGKLYGLKGKKLMERSYEVLDLVGLSKDAKKTVQQFSGGMKRRLSLSIALIHEPALLILDEPTVGIDPVLRFKLWETFADLRRSGVTIIVTSHVMDEADRCDRVGLIRDGGLIAIGTPSELKHQANAKTMEEAFLVFGGVKDAH